jgi:acetoin utilization protein AcuB
LKKVLQVIEENGGEIINVGVSPQRGKKKIYSFRLSPCSTDPIKQALEEEEFRVVAAMD